MRLDELSAEPEVGRAASAPRRRTLSLISAAIAIVVGFVAAANFVFYALQIGGFSGNVVFFVLLPLFGASCSLAGVLGAVGAWRFQIWGWWLIAWYCVFNIFGTFAPFVILRRMPPADLMQISWLLFVVAALAYFFMPSVRASYSVSGNPGRAAAVLFAAGFVCTALLFGYSAFSVLRGT
jgi:hypothetical protein